MAEKPNPPRLDYNINRTPDALEITLEGSIIGGLELSALLKEVGDTKQIKLNLGGIRSAPGPSDF